MSIYIESGVKEGNYSEDNSTFGKESVAKVHRGNSARLNGTTVVGDVHAGTSVKANEANVGGQLHAGTDVELISTNLRAKKVKLCSRVIQKSPEPSPAAKFAAKPQT